MIRFKIEVFNFDSKANRKILFERNMEVSEDFCTTFIVDHYLSVFRTLYPQASGINFLFM